MRKLCLFFNQKIRWILEELFINMIVLIATILCIIQLCR
nr:MAG TPA: hypothetical protein [Caudoviricetes sp.]